MQIMLMCTKYSANYKKSNVHQTIKPTYYTKTVCCFLSIKTPHPRANIKYIRKFSEGLSPTPGTKISTD